MVGRSAHRVDDLDVCARELVVMRTMRDLWSAKNSAAIWWAAVIVPAVGCVAGSQI